MVAAAFDQGGQQRLRRRERRCGVATDRRVVRLAHGLQSRHGRPRRSPVDAEPFEARSRDELLGVLVRQADAVASRLRARAVAARTVTIKLRYGDFTTLTRSVTAMQPVASGPAIADAARRLLEQLDVTRGVRLLGVSASGLVEGGGQQLSLDDVAAASWEDASQAVDDIRRRFGDGAIGPARLSRRGAGLRLTRRGQQQWGPDAPDT